MGHLEMASKFDMQSNLCSTTTLPRDPKIVAVVDGARCLMLFILYRFKTGPENGGLYLVVVDIQRR